MVGEWLDLTRLRAYLTGPLCLESGERLLAEALILPIARAYMRTIGNYLV